MHPQFLEASLTFSAAAMLAGYVGTRPERGRVHRLVVLLMLAMMTWTGGVALSRASDSLALSRAAALAAFVGVFAVPPLWLLLAAHVSGVKKLTRSFAGPLLVSLPSALAVLALATNQSHALFVRDAGELIDGTFAQWAGPLYWAWACCGFAIASVGVVLYAARGVRVFDGGERRRGLILISAAVVPFAASLAHNVGLGAGGYDHTPMLIGASVVVMFAADWRHYLVSTVPVARRDVIEHLADGVIVTDAVGAILDMNVSAEEMTGTTLAAAQGRHLVDVVIEQAVERVDVPEEAFRGVVDQLIAERGKLSTRIESRDGKVFEIRIASVRADGPIAAGLYLILREITKQARFEELMRQRQRLETVAGLAAGIAHEVNNPLAYVRSNLSHVHNVTEDLELGAAAKEELQEMRLVVEECIEGVDRIGRIIDRVRRFSRIGSEELAPASTNEIVRDAVRVACLGRFGSVALGLALPDGLPKIDASAEALTQAVTNLIVNAAQAVSERGGSVAVATRAVDDQIEIRVADDGPGISPDVRERVFDPFFTTKKTGEGTGLGLAVAFGIVREHGGVLLYDPPPEGGAAFLIRLPIPQVDSRGATA